MAAVGPIPAPAGKPQGSSLMVNALRIAMLAVLLGGSIYLLVAHGEWFENPRLMKTEVLSWGAWGPIAYVILYAVGPSFLLPGAVMTIAAGLAFGALWGAVWSLVGANLGALIAFAAGRFLGKSFVQGFIGERFRHLMDRLVRNGFYVILYLRIVPVIPYNALNLLAGASPIAFRDYFWASAIGMIPGTILFAFLGDALWHPMSPRFAIAVALILLCFAAGEVFRRRKRVTIAA
ncbi:MAG TPA: TVP38/TMEM64 family protein [Candidatus Binataceae bacterium]|nr:TVP38/TMEM64 family protein [Candidatus Binataceae bacterium]